MPKTEAMIPKNMVINIVKKLGLESEIDFFKASVGDLFSKKRIGNPKNETIAT